MLPPIVARLLLLVQSTHTHCTKRNKELRTSFPFHTWWRIQNFGTGNNPQLPLPHSRGTTTHTPSSDIQTSRFVRVCWLNMAYEFAFINIYRLLIFHNVTRGYNSVHFVVDRALWACPLDRISYRQWNLLVNQQICRAVRLICICWRQFIQSTNTWLTVLAVRLSLGKGVVTLVSQEIEKLSLTK